MSQYIQNSLVSQYIENSLFYSIIENSLVSQYIENSLVSWYIELDHFCPFLPNVDQIRLKTINLNCSNDVTKTK